MKNKLNADFWYLAACRAARTFCQVLLATLPASAMLSEVDWRLSISTAAYAGILSILTSLVLGIPENKED